MASIPRCALDRVPAAQAPHPPTGGHADLFRPEQLLAMEESFYSWSFLILNSGFRIPTYPVDMIDQSPSRPDIGHLLKIARNLVFVLTLIGVGVVGAQQATPSSSVSNSPMNSGGQKGAILLTIFLRHDQSKTLDQINGELRKQGYYKEFPPAGIEIVSWYVMMGIGQVITLRVPSDRLRDVNLAIEKTAWGGYRTEFYPTYDYKAIGEAEHAQTQ